MLVAVLLLAAVLGEGFDNTIYPAVSGFRTVDSLQKNERNQKGSEDILE